MVSATERNGSGTSPIYSFPAPFQIVDLYHARQHLWGLARKLHLNQEAEQRRWMMIHQHLLDKGNIENLVVALASIDSSNPELAEAIRTTANYFEINTSRMRYPEFRRQDLFVSSGVIEAACKTVIGFRCKQSGMFWTVRGERHPGSAMPSLQSPL